jgi:hypothetical protein
VAVLAEGLKSKMPHALAQPRADQRVFAFVQTDARAVVNHLDDEIKILSFIHDTAHTLFHYRFVGKSAPTILCAFKRPIAYRQIVPRA